MKTLTRLSLLTLAALPLLSPAGARAADLPEALVIHRSGAFEYGGVQAGIIHFEAGWKGYRHQRDVGKASLGYPQTSDGVWTTKARFHNLFDLSETIRADAAGSLHYEAQVSAEQPVETSTLALELYLPGDVFAGKELLINGQPLRLPASYERTRLFEQTPVETLTIPTSEGPLTFSGSFSLYIQDNRSFNSKPGFVAQLRFTPYRGAVASASLAADIRLK
jgi:hypothetical protein